MSDSQYANMAQNVTSRSIYALNCDCSCIYFSCDKRMVTCHAIVESGMLIDSIMIEVCLFEIDALIRMDTVLQSRVTAF